MPTAAKAYKPIGRYWLKVWREMRKYKFFYLLSLPALFYFALFRYVPMWGLLMAFQDYTPFKSFWNNNWVGVSQFTRMFSDPFFATMLRNTLALALMRLAFFFPIPIALAIMLNEVRHMAFKRIAQTVIYFPHFISWVVTASLTFFTLSVDIGFVNKMIVFLGGEQVTFLVNPDSFWAMILIQSIWKEAGWGTIIFMAAIAGIDTQLYEAAVVDGASRMRRIISITLPCIMPTIVVLLILRLGQIFDVGFEQILLMQNPLVREVAEIFDTYAYNQGIVQGQFSVGVAVGLFKSLIGLAFLMASNTIVRRLGSEGVY
ncbi:MAG: ABC transporter permease subunit [Clostridiales bacterium]|jgi:putative aldouronate transport system permease protein|nr:ABC transporter permease subunit [Clostridiales bacterium]